MVEGNITMKRSKNRKAVLDHSITINNAQPNIRIKMTDDNVTVLV